MKKLGVVYSLIHQRVKEKLYPVTYIWRKELFVILGRIYHIPKPYRHNVMEELIECGYMKWNKHDYLEIL